MFLPITKALPHPRLRENCVTCKCELDEFNYAFTMVHQGILSYYCYHCTKDLDIKPPTRRNDNEEDN